MRVFRTLNWQIIFNNLTIILFGLFPILPNNIKGLPVFLLILNSLLGFFTANKSYNSKEFKARYLFVLIMIGVYISYLLSGVYSTNLVVFYKKLETSLSLLLIPLGIFFSNDITSDKYINYFKFTFIYSTLFFIVLFWVYIVFDADDISSLFSIRTIDLRKKIDIIPIISLHPIYASIFFGSSILLLISIWREINFIYLIIALIVLSLNVLIMASKMVIVSLFFIGIFYLIKSSKKICFKIIAIVFILFTLITSVVYIPNLRQRFNEIVLAKTYEKVIIWNSTSIRNGINKCSIELLKNEWLLGYGLGDVQEKLNVCYENTSHVLLTSKYNTHNQYLSIWLGTGVMGLFLFLLMLAYNYRLAWRNGDVLFLAILILFTFNFLTENLLERQSGVIFFAFLINLFGLNNFNDHFKIKSIIPN